MDEPLNEITERELGVLAEALITNDELKNMLDGIGDFTVIYYAEADELVINGRYPITLNIKHELEVQA